jgi:nucleotide-binding universal stress UspA family protein
MSDIAKPVDTTIRLVLVATDLSKASAKPLLHALSLARHFRARFSLIHVVTSLGYTIAGPEALQLASEAAARDVRKLEQELAENGSLDGLEHQFVVRQGDVWKEIQSVIHKSRTDLLVIGTHGRRGVGKMFLGSVAEQIFRHADCPVLTVGPGSAETSPIENTDTVRPFLFTTDFGPASSKALSYAVSFANHFRAKLALLHVTPVAAIPESFHWSRTTGDVTQMQENARRDALRRLEEMASTSAPLTIEPEFLVRSGAPSQTILHVARSLEAELIVMGLNHSPSIDTASHMPWATAYKVVRDATCSVLTVRS